MRKWKLEHNSYWQNHNLYENASNGRQILTHITSEEMPRIEALVNHHNKQVDELESDARVINAQ